LFEIFQYLVIHSRFDDLLDAEFLLVSQIAGLRFLQEAQLFGTIDKPVEVADEPDAAWVFSRKNNSAYSFISRFFPDEFPAGGLADLEFGHHVAQQYQQDALFIAKGHAADPAGYILFFIEAGLLQIGVAVFLFQYEHQPSV
jgi:hypothetical protein